MPLTPAAASLLAETYCASEGITDPAAVTKWKNFAKAIYAALLTDLVVTTTIQASSIATVGGPAAQSGPAMPIPLVGVVT